MDRPIGLDIQLVVRPVSQYSELDRLQIGILSPDAPSPLTGNRPWRPIDTSGGTSYAPIHDVEGADRLGSLESEQQSGARIEMTFGEPFRHSPDPGSIESVQRLHGTDGAVYVTVQIQDSVTGVYTGNRLYKVTGEGSNRKWETLREWPIGDMVFHEGMVVDDHGNVFLARTKGWLNLPPSQIQAFVDIVKLDGTTLTVGPFDHWHTQSAMVQHPTDGVFIAGPEKVNPEPSEQSTTTIHHISSEGQRRLFAEIPGYHTIHNIFPLFDDVVLLSADGMLFIRDKSGELSVDIPFEQAENAIFIDGQLVVVRPDGDHFAIDCFSLDIKTGRMTPLQSGRAEYPSLPDAFTREPYESMWSRQGNWSYVNEVLSVSARLGWPAADGRSIVARPFLVSVGFDRDGQIVTGLSADQVVLHSTVYQVGPGVGGPIVSGGEYNYPVDVQLVEDEERHRVYIPVAHQSGDGGRRGMDLVGSNRPRHIHKRDYATPKGRNTRGYR